MVCLSRVSLAVEGKRKGTPCSTLGAMAIQKANFTEAQVIALLKEIFTTTDPRVLIGIGDDAAVVSTVATQIMTTDMAVAGVHFRTDWSSAFEIGRKVTAANTADVLAMSAKSDYLLVAIALTGSESLDWIEELARGIKYEADLAGASVIGGDISSANQVVISIAAIGSAQKVIARTGAKPGDGLYLSSLTGWSAAGLAILSAEKVALSKEQLKALGEFKSPTIDYAFDSSKATALCDISDALILQAAQLAEKSNVAIEFDLEAIESCSEFIELKLLAEYLQTNVWQLIFSGGEDHALLATGRELGGVRIGTIKSGAGLLGVPEGLTLSAWSHF